MEYSYPLYMGKIFRSIYLRLYISFLIIFLVTFFSTFFISSYFHSSEFRTGIRQVYLFHAHLLEMEYRQECGDSLTRSQITEDCRNFLNGLRRIAQLRLWILDHSQKVLFSTTGVQPHVDNSQIQEALSGQDVHFPIGLRGSISIVRVSGNSGGDQVLIIASPIAIPPRRLPFALPLILAGIVSAILILPLSIRISKPIRELHRVANAWSEGHLEQRAKVHGKDDISELESVFNMMAQKLSNMLNQRREFLALISHELKSPLARMRIALELLRDGQPDEARSNMIGEIEQNIIESEKLIEQLLVLSNVEMALPWKQKMQLDLLEILEKITNKLRPVSHAAAADVRMINATSENTIIVEGDADQLERAFGNILDNAMKFSGDHQEVTIEVKKESGRVDVQIADHGPGVDSAELQRIFEPFYRSTKNHMKNGSGLGLFIARRIIESHEGKISATLQKEGGMVISVQLPTGISE